MGALDFKEIPSAQKGADRDEFELFAREMLRAEGFRIVEHPDRGADDGRDIIAEEDREGPGGRNVIRWLVSCKHNAHAGSSVSPSEERGIRDRLETHRCGGFLAFYSTVPSAGLNTILRALPPKFEFLPFDKATIEWKLLESAAGRAVAARYMPESFRIWSERASSEREMHSSHGTTEGVVPAASGTAGDRVERDADGPERQRFTVATFVNHRPRCADLRVSDKFPQGSNEARFDLIPSLRFGTMEFDVNGVNVVVGLRRVLLHVSSDHGSIGETDRGEGPERRTGVVRQAGDVWEITDPGGGTLGHKALGDDTLCRIETPNGLTAHAKLEVTAARSDVTCAFSPPRSLKKTTEQVMRLFLEGALFQPVSNHIVLSEAELRSR